LGIWKCRINHGSSLQFQDAYLTATTDEQSLNLRLPKHLIPKRYSLYLTPFIEVDNFTVQGHVDIEMTVLKKGSKNITLHSDKLRIFENTVKVYGSNKQLLYLDGFGYDEARQFFVIHLAKKMHKGDNISVSIDFLGELNNDVVGFYKSSYFNEDENATEFLAVTNFKETGARLVFPCFDEPGYKAAFQVNLGRLKNKTSLSNMPIKFEGEAMKDNDVYVWDIYQETPVMSPHHLSFVISEFVYKQAQTGSNGVQFKVWSRESVSDQTEFAAEIGLIILEYFEQSLNISYPLPKLDLVAVPDFSDEAAANWGLITFRESALLFQDGMSSALMKEEVVETISHAIAKQWFGNLVTVEWWSE
jgi:aminopeptidase N